MTSAIFKSPAAILIYILAALGLLALAGKHFGWFDNKNVARKSNNCPDGYGEVNGRCQPIGGVARKSNNCPDGYEEVNGRCQPIGGVARKSNNCPDGYEEVGGRCQPIGGVVAKPSGCPDGYIKLGNDCVPYRDTPAHKAVRPHDGGTPVGGGGGRPRG